MNKFEMIKLMTVVSTRIDTAPQSPLEMLGPSQSKTFFAHGMACGLVVIQKKTRVACSPTKRPKGWSTHDARLMVIVTFVAQNFANGDRWVLCVFFPNVVMSSADASCM